MARRKKNADQTGGNVVNYEVMRVHKIGGGYD